MHKSFAVASIAGLLVSCSAAGEESLEIADAEAAGFEKGEQQIYQMVGASDGWSGTWAGETVELYQYESQEAVKPEKTDAAIQDGNVSGWVERCQHRNLLMLSKGDQACQKLRALSSN